MNDRARRRYDRALAYATQMHRGQKRIGGAPYITHPLAVAEHLRQQGYPLEYQITGLFHDLLEDTQASEDHILRLGGEAVLTAVKLLTKRPGYVMNDYVAGIRHNPMALAVKAADRLHNLQSALLADEAFKRQYIQETLDWYMDFSPEIPPAVEQLAGSLA